MAKIFRFEAKIGWPELVAPAALVVSIFAVLVDQGARDDVREFRTADEPKVHIETSYKAYDASALGEDGRGLLLYYYRFDMTNSGARPLTLRGLWNDEYYPLVVPMRGYNFVDVPLPVYVYSGTDLDFQLFLSDEDYRRTLRPTTFEQLASLNIPIPGGQTESVAFALAIRNDFTPADGYSFHWKFVFSNGQEHSHGEIISLRAGLNEKA
ncbi:hypothetical protein ACFLQW_01180, partial [Candidatus Zixiibacteriota bacterium]